MQSLPSQFLREFRKFKDLLQRKNIARCLDSEIKMLLEQLNLSLRDIQNNLKSRTLEIQELKGRNISHSINNIIWARQNISKIEETDTLVSDIIGQKTAYETLSLSLYEELQLFEREQFEYWVEVFGI